MALQNPVPPRLPDPQPQYDRGYFNSVLNVLRLYFNRLSNAIAALLGPLGGANIQNAYAEYVSTADQTVASTTVAYPVTFDIPAVRTSGVNLSAGSRLEVEVAGVFLFSFSAQVANSDSQAHTAAFWLRVNGVDVANSRSRHSIPSSHGGNPGQLAAAMSFYVELAALDYVQVMWFADNTQVYLDYIAPAVSPTRPAAPAATICVEFVSARPTL